jgi:ABC-type multidrug transport system ATPase subunit
MIKLKNVNFEYDSKSTFKIKDINIEFKKGVTYGIVGPNGNGKSTLLKLIIGALEPTSGEVIYNPKSITKKISFLPADIVGPESMRVDNFLSYMAGIYIRNKKERTKVIAEQVNA